MELSNAEKENWSRFKNTIHHMNFKKHDRTKRHILVEEKLWRDFSVCVIKNEGKSQCNSKVITELLQEYVKKYS